MKNMTYNLTNKNLLNLKKINLINSSNNHASKEVNDSKRLLHIYLMKFIKTQFNKNKDMLTKRAKCFPKYNNLHLLPYLKKKLNKKDSAKNAYVSSYSKITGFTFSKNQDSKTNNNINEYSLKDKKLENNFVNKAFKTREQKINKIKTNRIKSSFDLEPSKIKNNFKIGADTKYKLNNILFNKDSFKNQNNILFLKHKNSNFNIYNNNVPLSKRKNSSNSGRNVSVKNEDTDNENKKNDSRKNTQQKGSSLNFKNKTNSFSCKITLTKISNILNDNNNNTQVHPKIAEFEKNNKRFDNRKIENKDFQKNLTYREEKKDSKLNFATPEKNYLCNTINKNIQVTENKSIDKNQIANYIKSIYERRKTFSSENKSNSSTSITKLNIKKLKYDLKHSKNDYINFYKNKYNEYELIDSFLNTKEGNKINKIEKNSKLIESKKMEQTNKLSINTKIVYKNQNNMKWIRKCPIAFNKNINNKRNNNNDIIDLI